MDSGVGQEERLGSVQNSTLISFPHSIGFLPDLTIPVAAGLSLLHSRDCCSAIRLAVAQTRVILIIVDICCAASAPVLDSIHPLCPLAFSTRLARCVRRKHYAKEMRRELSNAAVTAVAFRSGSSQLVSAISLATSP